MAPTGRTAGPNRLLALLPRKEYARLASRLQPVTLRLREPLYEADEPIRYVYFPLTGLVSLVIAMNERQVEVATIGNEGMVGTPLLFGVDRSPAKAVSQVPAEALRMTARAFKTAIARPGRLRAIIGRYAQAMINQISQSVVCNQLHSVEQRMCRWLLMTRDSVGGDEVGLTHECLGQMLSARRSSVTVVAGILQRAGLITYNRGRIKIVDRTRLEAAGCDCYGMVRRQYERLLAL